MKAVFSVTRQVWITERLVNGLSGGARNCSR